MIQNKLQNLHPRKNIVKEKNFQLNMVVCAQCMEPASLFLVRWALSDLLTDIHPIQEVEFLLHIPQLLMTCIKFLVIKIHG